MIYAIETRAETTKSIIKPITKPSSIKNKENETHHSQHFAE
jgi:hypothetical protein